MFGPLGVPEILFILVLALLVFGPRRLPEVGRTLGKALGEFRRATTELKRSVNTELALEDDDERPRYTRTARAERERPDGERPERERTAGEEGGEREDGDRRAMATRDEPAERRQPEVAAPRPGTVPRGSGPAADERAGGGGVGAGDSGGAAEPSGDPEV